VCGTVECKQKRKKEIIKKNVKKVLKKFWGKKIVENLSEKNI
jgi:hypothetical protein